VSTISAKTIVLQAWQMPTPWPANENGVVIIHRGLDAECQTDHM